MFEDLFNLTIEEPRTIDSLEYANKAKKILEKIYEKICSQYSTTRISDNDLDMNTPPCEICNGSGFFTDCANNNKAVFCHQTHTYDDDEYCYTHTFDEEQFRIDMEEIIFSDDYNELIYCNIK